MFKIGPAHESRIVELVVAAQGKGEMWRQKKAAFEFFEEIRRVLCQIYSGLKPELRSDPSTWPEEWLTSTRFFVQFVNALAEDEGANRFAIGVDDSWTEHEYEEIRPLLRLSIAEARALPWIHKVRRVEHHLQCLLEEVNEIPPVSELARCRVDVT